MRASNRIDGAIVLKKLNILAVVAAFLVAPAQAELVIDVQGVAQPTPVAVVPFGWEGQGPGMPLDVAAVINGRSASGSGRFAPIA